MRVVRGVALGVVAAVVAGAVVGALARALMRLVTLAAGHETAFSWGATLGIMLVFVIAMVPGGVVAALTTHRLRWLAPIAGAVLLCVPAAAIASGDLGETGGLSVVQWIGVGLATLLIFGLIAVAPVATVRLADRFSGR
jgi:hypothetical protein